MTLRTRILTGSVLLILLPLALLGHLATRWTDTHFTTQYRLRVDWILRTVQDDLDARKVGVERQLRAFAQDISEDNEVRLYLQTGDPAAEEHVHDLAVRAMHLLGLDMLQIQDETEQILSCGQFWSAFETREPGLARALEGSGLVSGRAGSGWTLIEARRQEGTFLALAAVDSVRLGLRTLHIIGGVELTQESVARLARDPELLVRLELPEHYRKEGEAGVDGAASGHADAGMAASDSMSAGNSAGASDGARVDDASPANERVISNSVSIPFFYSRGGRDRSDQAVIRIRYPLADLDRFLHRFRSGLLLTLGILAAGSVLFAFWLSRRISRPIVDLARKAESVDLERLEASFSSTRSDEVGILAGCLDRMMRGLRDSAQRLREAEHRATLGELARQVNHDIKNGLIPLRNVFRHLTELLEKDPETLPKILAERRAVIDSSIVYLEDLAANYARIARRPEKQRCHFNAVIQSIGDSMRQKPGIEIRLSLEPDISEVEIDPIALRRIVENLLGNACESLADQGGTVTLSTRCRDNEDGSPGIELIVEDTGPGIPEEIRDRIFEDFFTTKERGSGLGLSIVRRLASDFGGSIRVENVASGGARFLSWFPSRTCRTFPDRESSSKGAGSHG